MQQKNRRGASNIAAMSGHTALDVQDHAHIEQKGWKAVQI